MEYIVYRRFKGQGIGGAFNLPYGTIVTEQNGYLFTSDHRIICGVTSENGWEHFRPNTEEAEKRQNILDKLYCFYQKNRNVVFEDVDVSKMPANANTYWKNLLRTMETAKLKTLYERRIGGKCRV